MVLGEGGLTRGFGRARYSKKENRGVGHRLPPTGIGTWPCHEKLCARGNQGHSPDSLLTCSIQPSALYLDKEPTDSPGPAIRTAVSQLPAGEDQGPAETHPLSAAVRVACLSACQASPGFGGPPWARGRRPFPPIPRALELSLPTASSGLVVPVFTLLARLALALLPCLSLSLSPAHSVNLLSSLLGAGASGDSGALCFTVCRHTCETLNCQERASVDQLITLWTGTGERCARPCLAPSAVAQAPYKGRHHMVLMLLPSLLPTAAPSAMSLSKRHSLGEGTVEGRSAMAQLWHYVVPGVVCDSPSPGLAFVLPHSLHIHYRQLLLLVWHFVWYYCGQPRQAGVWCWAAVQGWQASGPCLGSEGAKTEGTVNLTMILQVQLDHCMADLSLPVLILAGLGLSSPPGIAVLSDAVIHYSSAYAGEAPCCSLAADGHAATLSLFFAWRANLDTSRPLLLGVVEWFWLQSDAVVGCDQSSNSVVERFGRELLVPPDSIILTRGDLPGNSLRYLHYCQGVRPDVCLVDQEFNTLPLRSWYVAKLGQHHPLVHFQGRWWDPVYTEEKDTFSLEQFLSHNTYFHPGSWERVANEEMWQARMKTAFFLFDLAERIQGEGKDRLFELSYTLYKEIVERHTDYPPNWDRNLALASEKLLRSGKQGHSPDSLLTCSIQHFSMYLDKEPTDSQAPAIRTAVSHLLQERTRVRQRRTP
ncbi:hypothetical protein J4Q44_G00250330 [Coregonus suidteri]|uniref:Uncharacterized protein n=1 Tax=Coregonus suidteri TaxID=861788 RepID=A0AAN8QX06_9TELE